MRKGWSVLFACALVLHLFCSVIAVNAEEVGTLEETSRMEQVDRIIDEIGTLRTRIISNTNDGENLSTEEIGVIEQKIQDYERILEDYGVETLDQEAVNALFEKNGALRMEVPVDTDAVKWRSSKYEQLYEGKSYIVQRIYAQGWNEPSPLCSSGGVVKLYNSDGMVVNDEPSTGEKLVSILVQRGISALEVFELLPYELLFDMTDYERVTVKTCNITYAYTMTVCFINVYPKELGESEERLSYVSTAIHTKFDIDTAGVRDGEPYLDSEAYEKQLKALDYASGLVAAKHYATSLTEPPKGSYLDKLIFKDKYGTVKGSVKLPKPRYYWEVITK